MRNPYFTEASKISKNFLLIKRNFLVIKGFSLKYILYRILRPILKINVKTFRLFIYNCPWLSQGSILFLKSTLDKNMQGLEYGSGKSTIFFSARIGHLISVEHDKNWFNLVNKKLDDQEIKNVKYVLLEPKNIESKKEIEIRNQNDFLEELTNSKSYYGFALDLKDQSLDFIIIDGRARVECCSRAIPKLKNGGFFVLDNSERLRYKPVHDMLRDWKNVNTTTGLTDTTIWFKP